MAAEKLISVITPSLNQARFLEYCLSSIAMEREHGGVEHLVMDGGSGDGSVAIIQKHAGAIDYWRSQPDKGQSDAINNGMVLAKGEILCWINSDDALAPGASKEMRAALPDEDVPAWGIGQCVIIDERSDRVGLWEPTQHDQLDFVLKWRRNYIMQPAVFWNRSMWKEAGPLEQSLHYAMDFDLWLRFFNVGNPTILRKPVGVHRIQGESKTSRVGLRIFDEYLWALRKRLASDRRRKSLGTRNVCHALCDRANAELFYGNGELSKEAMGAALAASAVALVDLSFWKAAVKHIKLHAW